MNGHHEDDLKRQRTQYNENAPYSNVRKPYNEYSLYTNVSKQYNENPSSINVSKLENAIILQCFFFSFSVFLK